MANLRDTLTPKDWPDAGTPEFWERFGCEGSNEYRDCDAMSADYARLRRLERRMEALVQQGGETCLSESDYGPNAETFVAVRVEDLQDALKETGDG